MGVLFQSHVRRALNRTLPMHTDAVGSDVELHGNRVFGRESRQVEFQRQLARGSRCQSQLARLLLAVPFCRPIRLQRRSGIVDHHVFKRKGRFLIEQAVKFPKHGQWLDDGVDVLDPRRSTRGDQNRNAQ